MNGYTNERIKKEAELEALGYFLEAYEIATGKTFKIRETTESPDFVCTQQDGEQVGIELTKVRRGHPDEILWDEIVKKKTSMSHDQALQMIQRQAYEKEKKRRKPYWKLPESCILVIELVDIPLFEIENCISEEILPDLYAVGFKEVWIADFTELEAYDNVELFCVKPKFLRGYFSRGFQKPYG